MRLLHLRNASPLFQTLCSNNRAIVGIVAGGGRIDKPVLKASRSYHKYKAKRHCWPIVRGVTMNVSLPPPIMHVCVMYSSPLISSLLTIHTEVVTTSTSESPRRSREAHLQVAKLVSLLPGEQEGFVVGRESFTRRSRMCVIVLVYAAMTFDTEEI